jgi:hypothetical protein
VVAALSDRVPRKPRIAAAVCCSTGFGVPLLLEFDSLDGYRTCGRDRTFRLEGLGRIVVRCPVDEHSYS